MIVWCPFVMNIDNKKEEKFIHAKNLLQSDENMSFKYKNKLTFPFRFFFSLIRWKWEIESHKSKIDEKWFNSKDFLSKVSWKTVQIFPFEKSFFTRFKFFWEIWLLSTLLIRLKAVILRSELIQAFLPGIGDRFLLEN